MSIGNKTIEIIPVSSKQVEQAVEVYFSAFRDDALIRFFLGDADNARAKHLWQYVCHTSIVNGLLIGAFENGALQGVASVTLPESDRSSDAVTELETKLVEAIGDDAAMRLDSYVQIKSQNKPLQPHFYLNAIGVDSHSQGKGVGRALLSHLQTLSEAHPKSCGVALDTETEKNVGFYEHVGYRITSVHNLEGVPIWCMFRANERN